MRKRAVFLSILSSASVLVVGWQVGTAGKVPSPAATAPASPTSSASAAPQKTTAPIPGGSAPATSTAPRSASTGTFTGEAVATRYGDVQVRVSIAAGKITDVTALKLTDQDNRSVEISNRAAPVLRQEVLAAQSAAVDMVSGATYTSDGYLQSLQSALDQAGL